MVTTVPDWLTILSLLGLCALVVFGLKSSKAAGCKQTRLGWNFVIVPLGLLVGLSLFGGFLSEAVPNVPVWNQCSAINPVGLQIANSLPLGDNSVELNVPHMQINVTGVILIVVLVLIVLKAMRRSSGTPDQYARRRGWGKAILLLLVVFAGAMLWSTQPRKHIAFQQEQARQEMEKAKQKLKEAGEKIKQATDNANAANQPSMQQLWNELNKPRIQLEAEEPAASIETTVGGQTVTLEANPESGAKVVVDRDADAQPADAEAVAEPATTIAEEEVAEEVTEVETTDEPEAKAEDAEKHVEIEKESDRVAAATGPQTTDDQALTDSQSDASQERPDWVDDPPKRVGHVWREVIATDEYATVEECYQAADRLLMAATKNHIQRLTGEADLGDAYGARPDGTLDSEGHTVSAASAAQSYLSNMGIGIDYIRRQIVPEQGEYLETVERSFGPMKKLYTQLEFTASVDRELQDRWQAREREERLMAVGGLGGLVLGVVGLAYGLLKVDTWTKGYYTMRLFLAVPAAIISLLALATAIGVLCGLIWR